MGGGRKGTCWNWVTYFTGTAGSFQDEIKRGNVLTLALNYSVFVTGTFSKLSLQLQAKQMQICHKKNIRNIISHMEKIPIGIDDLEDSF